MKTTNSFFKLFILTLMVGTLSMGCGGGSGSNSEKEDIFAQYFDESHIQKTEEAPGLSTTLQELSQKDLRISHEINRLDLDLEFNQPLDAFERAQVDIEKITMVSNMKLKYLFFKDSPKKVVLNQNRLTISVSDTETSTYDLLGFSSGKAIFKANAQEEQRRLDAIRKGMYHDSQLTIEKFLVTYTVDLNAKNGIHAVTHNVKFVYFVDDDPSVRAYMDIIIPATLGIKHVASTNVDTDDKSTSSSKKVEDKIEAHKTAFLYARSNKDGLNMNWGYAKEFADKMITLENPLEKVEAHKTAFLYARSNKDGMNMNWEYAIEFADKMITLENPLETIEAHKKAFLYAKSPAGLNLNWEYAIKFADKSIGLED